MSDYALYVEEGFVVIDGCKTNKTVLNIPWELPKLNDLKNLSVNFVLQTMTSMEADLAMSNYFKALPLGAHINLCVPNLTQYLRLWESATWDETTLKDPCSTARTAFSGIFGEQISGNPRNDNYSAIDLTGFKSGYNASRLKLLVERAGFTNVEVQGENSRVLKAIGEKTMLRGERQIGTKLANIRQDHIKRYEFAVTFLDKEKSNAILDCACGIGYGTKMLSDSLNANVVGVDINAGAIAHANKYFSSTFTEYILSDARELSYAQESFDAVVSFETIEHVDFDTELLASFYQMLKPGGQLICSTPNENVMPFDKQRFPFHLKHYHEEEFASLLKTLGFRGIEMYKQDNAISAPVQPGNMGCFIITVATK